MQKIRLKNLKLKQLADSINKGTLIPIERVGQRLKDIREALGMTQKQMARKLNIRQPVISRIEENAESCSLKTIARIAKVLECEFMGAIASDVPLEIIIKRQAEKTAERILNRTYSNMAMEKQSPTKEAYKYQLEELIEELASNPDSKLWEE